MCKSEVGGKQGGCPIHDLFRLTIYPKRKDYHSWLSLSTAICWCDFPCFVSDVHVSFSSLTITTERWRSCHRNWGGWVFWQSVVGKRTKPTERATAMHFLLSWSCCSLHSHCIFSLSSSCLRGSVHHLSVSKSSRLFNLFRLNKRLKTRFQLHLEKEHRVWSVDESGASG